MDTVFATLACCLLAISCAEAQTEERNLASMPITTPVLNSTHPNTVPTSSNSTIQASVTSNMTVDTTLFTKSTWGNETFNKTTSYLETSKPAAILTPVTNSTSRITTMPGAQTPSFSAVTLPTIQTTAGYISTPETTGITTANSSYTVTITDSVDTVKPGFRLNISTKNLIIVFSVALGACSLALVIFMTHRCKQKIQYSHQPLSNTNDTDAFVADHNFWRTL